MLPRVSILMSTYNGEKYIREQIDSILKQKGVEVQILIRDDGSNDRTPLICMEYGRENANIVFYQGSNIGVGRSFMELLQGAQEADYYSFADQDDVWLDNKLDRAVRILNQQIFDQASTPALYTSNQILVDKDLVTYGMRFLEIPRHDLIQEIVTNKLSGCTMLMNKALRDKLLLEKHQPDNYILDTRLHDTWIMIVACILGVVIYDSESCILYRQHDNNVVGEKDFRKFEILCDKIGRYFSKKYKGNRSRVAGNVIDKFGCNIDDEMKRNLYIIAKCNGLNGAIKLLRNTKVRETFKESDLMILLKGILGWI